MSQDWRLQFYDDYLAFKSWDDKRPAVLDEIFAIEAGRTGISPPAAALEIGFGPGHFLDWAAAKGYRTTGVEIIASLVESAARRGHRALLGLPREVLNPAVDRFDLIAAFDVFEHMTVEEIADFLRFAASLLNPGGRLLPDGRHHPRDCPFGGPHSTDRAFRGARPRRRLQRGAAGRRHCSQDARAEGALSCARRDRGLHR